MTFIHAKRNELLFYVQMYGIVNVFYSWNQCHHCKTALPIVQAATAAAQYPVLQIISDENVALQSTAQLVGYPTIRQYQLRVKNATGQESDFITKEFRGPREYTQLLDFFNTT